jgi:NDP-sugar pyrophosphorylase family protein
MSTQHQAIVMAGGKGTRLHPYTAVLPKPLMPLGDAPVLELLLRQLSNFGIGDVVIAVNHLRHLIQAFFGGGSSLGMNIAYATEDHPLGTCGPVAQVLDDMADDFLLLNGDLLTDLDFSALLDRHRQRNLDATVAGIRRKIRVEYGVLDVDPDARLTGLREKPEMEFVISMGVYALRRDAIRPFLTPGEPLDMPQLLAAMIAAKSRVECFVTDCKWLDIGRPEDYGVAQAIVSDGYDAFVKPSP